jgi:hypothetical protein
VEWCVDVAVAIVSDVSDVSVCVEAVIVEDWNAEVLRQLNWQYSFKQLFEILLFDASLTSHQSVARKNWLFTSLQWIRSTYV